MNPEVVKTYPFLDTWRVKGAQYMKVPKEMLRSGKDFGLGMDEVALYAVLRDRANLSFKSGWLDEFGRVYIVFPRDKVAEYIGWSKRKTVDVFARLVDSGLLTEVEQRSATRMKKAKRLYVRQWAEPSILHTAEELREGGFNYLTERTIYGDMGPYYELPKVFFEEEALKGLPLRAILLYMIVLDEMHKSIRFGRVDKEGRVWCSVEADAAAAALGCSLRSLSSAYKELEEIGLVVRRRAGFGAATRIYLRDYLPAPEVFAEPPEEECPEGAEDGQEEGENTVAQNLHYGVEEPAPQSCKICTSATQDLHYGEEKAAPGAAQNLHPNKPSIHPYSNHPLKASIGAAAPEAPAEKKRFTPEEVHGLLQRQVSYPDLVADIRDSVREEDREVWYSLLDAAIGQMAEDLLSPALYIRAGDQVLERQEVLRRYQPIDRYIMYTLLSKLAPRREQLQDAGRYLHRCLLRAVEDHAGAAYYTKLQLDALRGDTGPGGLYGG